MIQVEIHGVDPDDLDDSEKSALGSHIFDTLRANHDAWPDSVAVEGLADVGGAVDVKLYYPAETDEDDRFETIEDVEDVKMLWGATNTVILELADGEEIEREGRGLCIHEVSA